MRGQIFTNIFFTFGFLFAISFVNLPRSDGARILGVFTSPSSSHFIVHMSVIKALAERGHNITVVSSVKPLITHPNVKHIIIPPTKEQDEIMEATLKSFASQRNNMMTMMIKGIFSMSSMISMQFDALKDERFTQLYSEKFDLIILGYFFNDFQLGIGAKFNCPIIINWMGSPIQAINSYVGNPSEIAYVPNMNIPTEPGEVMNFGKRFQNVLATGLMSLFNIGINFWSKSFYTQLFPSENFPTLDEMKKNISLVFCNSHFSEGPVRPNVPAIVEIGGIQIKAKPDPLPKDIADFLDSADNDGVIYFCLGSNLKSSSIDPRIVNSIFKTLANLKQKVIWKWDDLNNLPGKSPNILYKKWLPQDDILAHSNVKLFITHAGKGGIAESQYHAVPMLALPVFAEQPANAEKMSISGYGIKLDLLSLTENNFKNAILEVLGNPKYKENVKRFSQLYRDRPMAVKETVVYWTEYVLRYNGAKHMQSPLVYLNFFEKTSLDVIGTLLLVFYIIYKVIKLIIRTLLNKIKWKKESKDKKLKQN